ncbi:ATP-binding cassette, subfamily G (WHITE), member 1 [Nematocida sp. AWRm80]|nr:ATP-binding cassette, subfamily G (WHITE), member 1 [Nematocida sp. AWRm80]
MDKNKEYVRFENYTRVTSKGIELLKNASFKLNTGTTTAIIGLSGEGKSTLMDTIAGLCPSKHKAYGRIMIGEEGGIEEDRKVNEWYDNVGYVFQTSVGYENIPLQDLLYSVCRCTGKTNVCADNLIRDFKLEKTVKTKYKKLSGGEQKRAMIIIGLLMNRELNLWDEPISGLDIEMAKVALMHISNSGKTNLITIHQISSDLLEFFDNILILQEGTVIYNGSLQELEPFLKSLQIQIPENVFLINYILKLCTYSSNNEVDQDNIAKIKNYIKTLKKDNSTRELKKQRVFPLRKLGFNRVFEIIYRSMYFEKLFKGLNLFIELIIYTGFLSLLLLLLNFLKSKTNEPSTTIQDLNNLASLLRNHNILIVLSQLQFGIDNYFLIMLCVVTTGAINFSFLISSTLCIPKYYALSKRNIKEKLFTPFEFIMSMVVDVLLRKALLSFIFSISIVYCILYNLRDLVLLQYSIGEHIMLIFGIFVTSLTIGLYNMALATSPLTVRLRNILSIFISLILVYGLMLAIAVKSPEVDKAYNSLDIYRIPNRYLFNTPSPGTSNPMPIENIYTTIINVLTQIVRYSPIGFIPRLLIYTKVYTQKYPERVTFIKDVSLSEVLSNKHSFDNIGNFQKYIYPILGNNTAVHYPYELLSPSKYLHSIGIFDIVWSTGVIVLIPLVLAILSSFYLYRNLQPKLR